MKTRMLLVQIALAVAAMLYASAAAAVSMTLIDCLDERVPGAIANSALPEYCAIGNTANDSPATETAAINAVFAGFGGAFSGDYMFIGKYDRCVEDCESVPGYSIRAFDSVDPFWQYMFEVISDFKGQTVDFVLMVKQPEEPGAPDRAFNVAYAWHGLTLDIEGFYNSFQGDFSHISGFIRGPERVHEPGVLMLLGAGLLGFVLLRRRLS